MYREDRGFAERPVESRDFVYGDDRGVSQQGIPRGYNIPDDERFNLKGKPIINPKAPLQEVMSKIEDTYDPESELASFQYLMVTGQVETGEVYGSELMKVKLDFIAGKDWEVVHGCPTGESQISRKTSGKGLVTWNMDFDIGWRTLTPSGWPQLVLQFIGPNSMGNECLRGYACIHVPTRPGRHTRRARIFCPVKDSWWSVFKSKLFGVESIMTDNPELIASAEGREVTAVMYIGSVNIMFNSMQRNYTRFGYDPRVLRAVDEEWRKEKLIMPDIPVVPGDLPHEEGEHTAHKEEENAWSDLSINEMIGAAHLSVLDRETADQNDMNIYGLNLDSRFFTQNPSLI